MQTLIVKIAPNELLPQQTLSSCLQGNIPWPTFPPISSKDAINDSHVPAPGRIIHFLTWLPQLRLPMELSPSQFCAWLRRAGTNLVLPIGSLHRTLKYPPSPLLGKDINLVLILFPSTPCWQIQPFPGDQQLCFLPTNSLLKLADNLGHISVYLPVWGVI